MSVQIGDLIRDEPASEEVAIIEAVASNASERIHADDFFWRKKFKVPGRREFAGLAKLIEDFPTSFSYGTDFGVESVAVPFSHVYILCNQKPPRAERLAAELAQKIERRWKAAIDPIVGARASFLEFSDPVSNSLKVFFGAGVFVPPPDEQPVGTLEIEPLGPGKIQKPTLGETGCPAGLYRAQFALAFSSMPGLAPAAVDLALEHPFVIFLAAGGSSLPPHRPLDAISLERDGSHAGYKIRRNQPEPEPDGDDIADEFVVSFNGENTFLMRYRADIRPSRLRRCPRPGRLAITGIIEPRANGRPLSDHWWVDIDSDGILIGSTLVPKAQSVAVLKGNVRSYDWHALAHDRKNAREYRVEPAPCRGQPALDLRILRKLGAKPFGYLQRPSEPSLVTYRATPDVANSYALDWLEFAAGVEMTFQRQPLTALSQPADGDVMLGPANANWAIRAPNGVLYRETSEAAFQLVNEVPWRPGGELTLGPLVVSMLGDR